MKRSILILTCLSLCFWMFTFSTFAETEPNDSFTLANSVEAGSSIDGSLSTDSPSDTIDCFTITSPSDGYFVFAVVPTSELDVMASLYDSNQNRLLGQKNEKGKGGNEGIVYPNLLAGTYYAVVKIPDGVSSSGGDYSATFSLNPVDKIDEEPNDTFHSANPLSLGSNTSGNLGYHGDEYTDKRDLYVLDVTQNGSLTITLEPDGTLNGSLALFDSNRIFNTVNEDRKGKGEVESFAFNNLAAGRYYIEIAAREGFGSYNITSQFEEAANTPANTDGIGSALPLLPADQTEGTVQGQLGFRGNQVQDDIDYFTFSTSEYGKITLDFTTDFGENLDLYYELFDSSLKYRGNHTGHNKTFSGLDAGTYYLRVQRRNGYGSYTLTTSFEQETPPERFEIPQTSIDPNGTITGILLDEEHTHYWYKLNLPEDGMITIKTNFTSEGNVWTNLYNTTNKNSIKNVNNYYTAEERTFTVNNLRKGTYLIGISRNGGATVGSISTEYTPLVKIDTEPNDEYTSLTPIALNATYEGHLGYEGNGWNDVRDCYVLDIVEDGKIDISLTSEPTANIWTNLYDLTGKTIQIVGKFNNYYTEDARGYSKRNLPAGKYVVIIDRHGGYGSYTLDLQFTPNRSNDPEFIGDDWSMAPEIELGQGYVGHLGYDNYVYSDRQDFYKIILPQDGYLDFHFKSEDTVNVWCNLYYDDVMAKAGDVNAYYRNTPVGITHTHLEAGTYYLQLSRAGGEGTYQFFTTFTPQEKVDSEPNDPAGMAAPVQLNAVVQGHTGYDTLYSMDTEDWYSFEIPTDGTYNITYHGFKHANYWFKIFHANRVSELRGDNRYYNSDYFNHALELTTGTYYLQVSRNGGWGAYSFSIRDPETITTGTVTGIVNSNTGFPLPEIEVEILEHQLKTATDFLGQYTYENLAPGTYSIAFKSGAKYYPAKRQFTIAAGETTTLDIVMQDGNKTAPADVEYFFGIPDNHFIHLFWPPSVSPDVPTGGGYNLYINGGEAIDLGDTLNYRSLEFENGVQYTLRLTVYDQYGNESEGKTIVVTPSGEGGIPIPTPTTPPTLDTPTPTPTRLPDQPTATPTVTPTPVAGETPSPTGTPVVIPTPTPVLSQDPEPYLIYEFDQSTMSANGWSELPGGFQNAAPGAVFPQFTLSPDQFPSSQDQTGIAVLVQQQQVTFLLTENAIETNGYPVLIRLSLRANEAGASVVLGALKGNMFTAENMDGSIGMDQKTNTSALMDHEGRMCMIYQADSGSLIHPFIQIAGSGQSSVNILVDKLEIYRMEHGYSFPSSMFMNQP